MTTQTTLDASIHDMRALLMGCSACDYDEAEGALLNHCAKCQFAVTIKAWEMFISDDKAFVHQPRPERSQPAGDPRNEAGRDRVEVTEDGSVYRSTRSVMFAPLSLSPAASDEKCEHVAWLRYKQHDGGRTTIHLCDSDSPGAFKVYPGRNGTGKSPAPCEQVGDSEFDELVRKAEKGWLLLNDQPRVALILIGHRALLRAALEAKNIAMDERDALLSRAPSTVEQVGDVQRCKDMNRTVIRKEVLRCLLEHAINGRALAIDEPENTYIREAQAALESPQSRAPSAACNCSDPTRPFTPNVAHAGWCAGLRAPSAEAPSLGEILLEAHAQHKAESGEQATFSEAELCMMRLDRMKIRVDEADVSILDSAISELRRLARGDQWIDVNERLPDELHVLVGDSENGFVGDYWRLHEKSPFPDDITHWQPLPAPPHHEEKS